MAQKTPPLKARGRYTLKAPWDAAIDPLKLYTTIAIRSFKDIYELNVDVYTEYYLPMGLVDGVLYGIAIFSFSAEANLEPNIITLYSDTGETIYVPDTYILSYPTMGDIKYNRCVLSIDLGPLPDYLDFSSLKASVQNLVAQTTGIAATALEHRSAHITNPTPPEHEVLETARLAGITVLETDLAKRLKANADKILLQDKIDTLIEILADNSIAPFG
jgi:hypothetical protein